MVDPSSRIAVVVNGNAKSVTEDVISTLHQILKGSDLFVSRHIDEAPEIARTLVERGYGTVLTGGGDGTFTVMVTEVVRAAKEFGKKTPRFGLLKLGTGNALAWVVGATAVGSDGLSADIERLHREAGSREIRLVEVEGTLSPFAGLGADARVLADYNATKDWLQKTPFKPVAAGLLSYGISAVTRTLPAYLLGDMPHVRVVNTGGEAYRVGPGGRVLGTYATGALLHDGKARICALGTIPFYGFGLRMFPFAEQRPDRMHLRLATITSLQFVTQLKSIWEGTFENPSALDDFLVEAVSIECEPSTDFQVGGDPRGKRTRVEARISAEPIQLVDFYAQGPAE